MMPGSSPRICLDRCDEDIDLLSELLNKSSDELTVDGFDMSNGMVNSDIDELTNYLNRTSERLESEGSERVSPVDPYLSPLGGDSPISSCHSPVHTEKTCTSELGESHKKLEISPANEATVPNFVNVMLTAKTQQSMNKNAITARENRLRKKQYVQELEGRVKTLKTENSELKVQLTVRDEAVDKLNEEVRYLRSVIANESTLSALLQNIQNTGVKLKSSFSAKEKLSEVDTPLLSQKNPDENQENKRRCQRSKRKFALPSECLNPDKRIRNENADQEMEINELCGDNIGVFREQDPNAAAGVCLHVSGKEVSLEFCATCSQMAASSRVLDDHSYVRSSLGS